MEKDTHTHTHTHTSPWSRSASTHIEIKGCLGLINPDTAADKEPLLAERKQTGMCLNAMETHCIETSAFNTNVHLFEQASGLTM